MAKPIKTLELHYQMIQFLTNITYNFSRLGTQLAGPPDPPRGKQPQIPFKGSNHPEKKPWHIIAQ